MAQIRVQLKWLGRDLRFHKAAVELPDDKPVEAIVPTLVERLGLSPSPRYHWDTAFAGGTRPGYELSFDNPEETTYEGVCEGVREKETLAQAGVQDGDFLALHLVIIREAADVEDMIVLANDKTFRRTAVAIALQVDKYYTGLVLPKSLALSHLLEFVLLHGLAPRAYGGINVAMINQLSAWRVSPSQIRIRNETQGKAIDTGSSATVGDVIHTGDHIRIMWLDKPDITIDEEQDLLEQIEIYSAQSA